MIFKFLFWVKKKTILKLHTKEGWKGYIFEYSHKTLLYSLEVVACASHVLLSLIAKLRKEKKEKKKDLPFESS